MSVVPQETCWTLIRGAAAGRVVEREEFTRRYVPTVRAYLAARWQDSPMRNDVEDGVQEVFLACFRKGGALAGLDTSREQGFRAFLYAVARNVALHLERTHARREKRIRPGLPDTEDIAAGDETPSRVFDREYARAIMTEAAETMAAMAREEGGTAQRRVELLRLRFEAGMPIREIARLWDADAAELHREYAKAGREFRTALRKVVGLAERCAADRLEAECERLLGMLR